MDNIISVFFEKTYEEKINKDLLYYTFPHDDIEIYVKAILNEPLERFLLYIKANKRMNLLRSEDVFQFSNFSNATDEFCKKLEKVNNPGLTCLQMGKLLQDDGKERTNGAFVKYGENHSKAATELGLAFELCNIYYLSGIGYIYNELTEIEKEKMLVRLILRSTLIQKMYQASQNGIVNLRELLCVLANSTYLRRKSNVKKILIYLLKSSEIDFSHFVELIKY